MEVLGGLFSQRHDQIAQRGFRHFFCFHMQPPFFAFDVMQEQGTCQDGGRDSPRGNRPGLLKKTLKRLRERAYEGQWMSKRLGVDIGEVPKELGSSVEKSPNGSSAPYYLDSLLAAGFGVRIRILPRSGGKIYK
jgi:hypothetical protein